MMRYKKAVRWADKGTLCPDVWLLIETHQRKFSLSWMWNARRFECSVVADMPIDSGECWRSLDKEYAQWQRQKETP